MNQCWPDSLTQKIATRGDVFILQAENSRYKSRLFCRCHWSRIEMLLQYLVKYNNDDCEVVCPLKMWEYTNTYEWHNFNMNEYYFHVKNMRSFREGIDLITLTLFWGLQSTLFLLSKTPVLNKIVISESELSSCVTVINKFIVIHFQIYKKVCHQPSLKHILELRNALEISVNLLEWGFA